VRIAVHLARCGPGLTTGAGACSDQTLFLPGFRLASSLFLLLFSLLPTGIGFVFLYGLGESLGLFAKILLIDDSIAADDECHHAGRSVLGRIGREGETVCHLAICNVTLRAARAIFPLTSQDVKIVTAIRSRSARRALGIALSNCRCHQWSDRTLGIALAGFPIKAVVLPFITEDLLGILAALRRVFLFRRRQFLANADGR